MPLFPSLTPLQISIYFASLNSVNLGYDVGVSSGLNVMLREDMNLSDSQMEVYLGLLNFASLAGCALSPYFSSKHGRLSVFVLSSVLFIIGLSVQVFAFNYLALIIGRLLVGVGVGVGLSIDPVYIAEVCPAETRGANVTMSEVSINVGITIGYAVAYFFRDVKEGWRILLGMGCAGPVIIIYMVVRKKVSESPRWMVVKGRKEEAIEVIKVLLPGEDVEERITEIQRQLNQSVILDQGTKSELNIRRILTTPDPILRRMLYVGVMVTSIQQLTGIDGVQYYMHDILKEAGVKGEGERFGLVFLLGLLKTVATYMAGTRLDKSGRRPMLLASLTIMFIGLLQLTASLSTSSLTWLALLGVSVYFVGFSIGVGPVCWLYASEIYPTRLRPLLMSMCTVANRIAGTIVAGTVTTVEGVTGVGGYYGILAGITAVSWVGVWGLVRETKGVELEDMRAVFEGKRRKGAAVLFEDVDGGDGGGRGFGRKEREEALEMEVEMNEVKFGKAGSRKNKKTKKGKQYGMLGDSDEDEIEEVNIKGRGFRDSNEI